MNDSKKAESVIWIASYPKSGNTWIQSVFRKAGKSIGFPDQDLDVYKMKADKREPDVVGCISPQVNAPNPTVLKTHNGFPSDGRIHPELRLKTAGFVYVMRNPLDVLLSYINFTRLQYQNIRDTSNYREALFLDLLGFDNPYSPEEWIGVKLEDIPRRNLDHALFRFTELNTEIPALARTTGGTWLEHCFAWREAGTNLPSVFLRYEDLLAGAESFFPVRTLFSFSEAQLTHAVYVANERARGRHESIFFNKMSAYYFSQFFSADVTDRFLQKFESELKLLGYHSLF